MCAPVSALRPALTHPLSPSPPPKTPPTPRPPNPRSCFPKFDKTAAADMKTAGGGAVAADATDEYSKYFNSAGACTVLYCAVLVGLHGS